MTIERYARAPIEWIFNCLIETTTGMYTISEVNMRWNEWLLYNVRKI